MRFFLFLLALLAVPAMAQDTPAPAEPAESIADDLESRFETAARHDARLGLVTAKERGGVQRVVMERGQPTLYASIRNGTVLDWIAVREDGQFMSLRPLETTGDDGGTLCWTCGDGADGALHCWQIECRAPEPSDDG